MKKSVGSVVAALEGEISLGSHRVKFSPARRSLLDKDSQMDLIQRALNLQQNNSESQVDISKYTPTLILSPHRNVEEVRKQEANHRKSYLRSTKKIIEK